MTRPGLLLAALALAACKTPPDRATPATAAPPPSGPPATHTAPLASSAPATSSAPVTSSAPAAPTPPPPPPEHVCHPEGSHRELPDSEQAALKQVARSFYVSHTLARRQDTRLPSQHPMQLHIEEVLDGEQAKRCVDFLAKNLVFGSSRSLVATSRYVMVKLSFNDAGDGEYDHNYLIDMATKRVVVAEREGNFVP